MALATAASWVFAMLMIVAGAAKVGRPEPTHRSLRAAGLAAASPVIRGIGVGEIALGLVVVVFGGSGAAAGLAAAYALFALVASRQRRAGADCGCFGADGAPVTALHVWLDVTAASVATVAAVAPAPSLIGTVAVDLRTGLPLAALVAVAAATLRLLLTAAPDLAAAITLVEPDGTA